MSVRSVFLSAVLMALLAPALALAQAGGGGDGGGQGGRGGRGGFDPAQMRERMMAGIKDQLGATEEEWKVLLPKIEKLMAAQRESRVGFFGGFGGFGRGGRGGPAGGEQPQSELARAAQELRSALENKETPADTIAARLTAYREARDKARAAVTAAQKELKELLTQRQEAVLVNMGMLD